MPPQRRQAAATAPTLDITPARRQALAYAEGGALRRSTDGTRTYAIGRRGGDVQPSPIDDLVAHGLLHVGAPLDLEGEPFLPVVLTDKGQEFLAAERETAAE